MFIFDTNFLNMFLILATVMKSWYFPSLIANALVTRNTSTLRSGDGEERNNAIYSYI